MLKYFLSKWIAAVLSLLLCTVLSACGARSVPHRPTAQIVIEADPAALKQRAQTVEANDAIMAEAVTVMGNRLRAFGDIDLQIKRIGANRLSIEVAGLGDAERVVSQMTHRGTMEFRLVDEESHPDNIAKGKIRSGSEILPYRGEAEQTLIALRTVGGFEVKSVRANQVFNQYSNAPAVALTFDEAGKAELAEFTSQNVGKSIAIVVDRQVLSVPRILDPITSGSAQIEGSFTVETANALAITLASGQLPVEFKVAESRMTNSK